MKGPANGMALFDNKVVRRPSSRWNAPRQSPAPPRSRQRSTKIGEATAFFFFTSSSASFSRFIDFPFLVSRNFIVRQRIPSHSTGFYWVLSSFTELYWILPCFHLVLTGFTGFYEVLEWLPSSKGLTPNISSIGSEKWELTIGVGRNRFSKPIGSLR